MPTPEELAAAAEKAVADAKRVADEKKTAEDAAIAAAKAKADAAAAAAEEGEEEDEEIPEDEIPEFLAKATPEVKKAYLAHNKGLLSALRKEREFRKTNKDVVKEAAALKAAETKRQEVETKRKEAEMTETEKLRTQVLKAETERDSLKQKLAETLKKAVVARVATKLEFIDPDDAFILVEAEMKDIDATNKDGITEIAEILLALAKAKPYLIKVDKGDGVGSPLSKSKKKKKEDQVKSTRPLIRF